MSQLQSSFPLGHRVFQGGRYLRALDHLSDIDHYEHSILTYIGSLMPFDKAFVDHPAFPSIGKIAASTKISASTVRDRLKALKRKGYVDVKEVRFLNTQGHFQQSSNNYYLSTLAFDFFESVIQSQEQIGQIMKRAVGESFSFPIQQSSPAPDTYGHFESEALPLSSAVPNSPSISLKEILNDPGYSARDPFTQKAEVDRISENWKQLLSLPVSTGEKSRFYREYVRSNGNEIYYSERILQIADCPYLISRAKSINFLFSGLDCAIKNRGEIVRNGGQALLQSRTGEDLEGTLKQLPSLITQRSKGYGKPSDAIIRYLLQDTLKDAKRNCGIPSDKDLPKTDFELKSEILALLNDGVTVEQRSQLETILEALQRLNFGHCLELYYRFTQRLKAGEAAQ